MYEIIYLEPDVEITSVIDRLKNNSSKAVALVVPRGATLAQSVVNLKLLKRSAQGINKQIAVISTDKISRNLAAQVGLTVFSKVQEAENATVAAESIPEISASGFKVNNYYNKKSDEIAEDEDQPEDEDLNEEEDSSQNEELDDEEELKAEVRKNLEENDEEEEEEPTSERKNLNDNSSKAKQKEKPERKKQNQGESRKEAIVDDEEREEEEADDEQSEEIGEKSDVKKPNASKLKKILIIASSVVVLMALVGAYFIVPYADAKVTMKTEDKKFEKEVIVDTDQKDISVDGLKIPGQMVEVEKEMKGNFQATGTNDLGEKAKGKVTIYNDYLNTPEIIPKGSRFVSNGKAFISDAEISVPGFTYAILPGGVLKTTPGSAEVAVTAEKPGDGYNIAANSFTITSLAAAKQAKITAKSATAMTGGLTKEVKIIQDDDLAGAEKKLVADAKKTSASDIQQKAGESNLNIFSDSIKSEVASSTSSKKEGDEADNFDYVVKVKFYALGYLSADLTKLAVDRIQADLTENQMVISPEDTKIEAALVSSDIDSGMEKIKATGQFKAGSKISDQEVIKKIKGKKIGTAKNAIESIDGVSSSNILIKPSFIKQVPFLNKRIKVEFGFEAL